MISIFIASQFVFSVVYLFFSLIFMLREHESENAKPSNLRGVNFYNRAAVSHSSCLQHYIY